MMWQDWSELPAAGRPANFDAMCAAWNDPIEFAKQVEIYNEQLARARKADA